MRKKIRNKKFAALLLALGMALAAAGCGAGQSQESQSANETTAAEEQTSESSQAAETGEEVSEKDDFFEAVNGETLSQWEIEEDESSKSWFSILEDNTREQIAGIIKEVSSQPAQEAGSDASNIRALYLTGKDQQLRNETGYGPTITAYFQKVDQAQTVEELTRAAAEFARTYGIYSIFGLDVGSDVADSNRKVLYLTAGDVGLSREIWMSEDENNQKIASYYQEYLESLCQIEGKSPEESVQAAQEVVDFMKELAQSNLSTVESMDVENIYNIYTVSQLEELFSGNLSAVMLQEVYGVEADEPVIVPYVATAQLMGSYLTDENLPLLKNYIKLCLHKDVAHYIDMETQEASDEMNRKGYGLEKSVPFEENLMENIQSLLGFQCGRLYCDAYYSEETTQDVTEMINQVIDVFDRRLENLDWMSSETKAEARNKLAHLTVRVGHPDQWPQERFDIFMQQPEEGGTYIENILIMNKAGMNYSFETRKDPVDKNLWVDTPQVVNAYYSPNDNSINILAGILQPPIYDPQASDEENLGAIGMVIGHEITHAFDTSGSQYDENGNYRDWWAAEDKENFQQLAQEVVDYYDGMEIDGKQVDGTLTLTENIADLGGISCVTQIAQEKGYDLKKIYESFATMWATKYRSEYLSQLLAIDTHSPAKIRVNASLSSQPAFRETYDIQEGDGMYYESMPGIW